MNKIFFNKNVFDIIETNEYKEDYLIVTAVAGSGIKHKFELWNDGFVQLAK